MSFTADLKRCFPIEYLLFGILFIYIIARAFLVFYVHDEIATKYAYMVDWNFIPFTGYIDANNHFFNSFLGGLFIRLFSSDAIWVVRLGSILAFPVFFFSLTGFKPYFKHSRSYYFFLIALSCNVYLLEFFSMARGYALAWSFMLMTILFTVKYIGSTETKQLIPALIACFLSVYSNLSVFAVCLLVLVVLLYTAIRIKKITHLIFLSFLSAIFSFLTYYVLNLNKIGKLYLGEENNFIGTTIHSLNEMMFRFSHWLLDAIFILASLAVLLYMVYQLLKKQKFRCTVIFPAFFVLSLVSIFVQNTVLDINFPEDRAAAFLIILFIGSIAYLFDRLKWGRAALGFSGIAVILLLIQSNLSYTRTYQYEHFDNELLTLIPEQTKEIPTSTGGRFWSMDSELSKEIGTPMRMFQNSTEKSDTLSDYIIQLPFLRPEIEKNYRIIHTDDISELTLYERKQFLDRKLTASVVNEIETKNRYHNLWISTNMEAAFIRCTGELGNFTPYDNLSITFSVEDTVTGDKFDYSGVNPVQFRKLDKSGKVRFDFTYTLKNHEKANKFLVYIINTNDIPIKGTVRIEHWKIGSE